MSAPEKIYAWQDPTGEWHTRFEFEPYGPAVRCESPDTYYTRSDLVPQWQPIETAPKDNKSVLLYCPHMEFYGLKPCQIVGVWHGDWWHDLTSDGIVRPTHWQPLLEPPACVSANAGEEFGEWGGS